MNESRTRAAKLPHATVEDALAQLPMFAVMVAAANVAAMVVLFQRTSCGVAKRLGLATD